MGVLVRVLDAERLSRCCGDGWGVRSGEMPTGEADVWKVAGRCDCGYDSDGGVGYAEGDAEGAKLIFLGRARGGVGQGCESLRDRKSVV